MSNRPKIRFNGYQSEWQTEKFSSVFTPLRNNTLSRAELNDEDGKAKNIHYGDILIKFGEYLDAEKEDIPFITSDELAEKWSSFALQNGDVIMADTAEDSTVGKCTEIGNMSEDMPIVSGLHTIPVRPNADFASGYLGYFMNSDAYHDQLLPLIQGTKVSSIAKTYLGETDIHFPPDISEQEKIASFLRHLNDLIIAQQQKCEKLVALKSACLGKMFPKKGSKVPEMRCDGFTEEWEQHELGEFGSVSMCKRIFKEQTADEGDIPFYKIGTFGGQPDAFISRDLFEEFKAKYPYPEVGDILISASGSIGRTVEYTGKDEYFQDSNIVWLSHDGRIDNSFLKCFYQIVKWSGLEGSTIKRLYNENILRTQITLPSLDEQKQIGSFMASIDNLITLHQSKLGKLKQLKRAMLNDMFV